MENETRNSTTLDVEVSGHTAREILERIQGRVSKEQFEVIQENYEMFK